MCYVLCTLYTVYFTKGIEEHLLRILYVVDGNMVMQLEDISEMFLQGCMDYLWSCKE